MMCAAVCLAKKLVGKPDAVAPHVRFDERGGKTELRRGLRHRHLVKAVGNSYSPSPNTTASLLDSTTGLIVAGEVNRRDRRVSGKRYTLCGPCRI